ncbi:Fanconi anemia group C protein [Periophthalmus magnuspinnatus]|uniref:Fanconi anemia group C protein n=1 Tax=Periophthalmus magnuspinnatus TaxID=409849 RepID=UPI002436D5A6|nr:Fanconi anemia group C protein [Periophthalmus magnuspinnatus]
MSDTMSSQLPPPQTPVPQPPPVQTPPLLESEVDIQELQFWFDTVKTWDQTDRTKTHEDICVHLRPLRAFLHKLQASISSTGSTTEVLRKLPLLGQFLGRLCWIFYVTADSTSRLLLFQCLWGMYSEEPGNVVEAKANQWIRKILCQLTTDEDITAEALMKHLGVPSAEYHLKVLRTMLARVGEHAGVICTFSCDINQSCPCEIVQATAEACVPLVTCPEAASLIGALLKLAVTSVKAPLTDHCIQAISSAHSSQLFPLDGPAMVSLWWYSVSSLEETVLSLMEQVLTNNKTTPHEVQHLMSNSLLPKACAQHCSMFLMVNEIFRSALKQMEQNEFLKCFIKTFTMCFLKELAMKEPRMSLPLKAYFPKAPADVLLPLLTQPSEMSEDAWRDHLSWVSGSLQRLSEEEERNSDGTNRAPPLVFEAWFLLVCCSQWLDVALQLLVSSQDTDYEPLLWLLTFYHHPTNRGHHRDQHLVVTREAWRHMCVLYTDMGAPPPDTPPLDAPLLDTPPLNTPPLDTLPGGAPLVGVPPSGAPASILQLLYSFAIFSPLSGSTQVLQTVVERSGVTREALCVLSSLEMRLRGGGYAHTLLPMIKALKQALAPKT